MKVQTRAEWEAELAACRTTKDFDDLGYALRRRLWELPDANNDVQLDRDAMQNLSRFYGQLRRLCPKEVPQDKSAAWACACVAAIAMHWHYLHEGDVAEFTKRVVGSAAFGGTVGALDAAATDFVAELVTEAMRETGPVALSDTTKAFLGSTLSGLFVGVGIDLALFAVEKQRGSAERLGARLEDAVVRNGLVASAAAALAPLTAGPVGGAALMVTVVCAGVKIAGLQAEARVCGTSFTHQVWQGLKRVPTYLLRMFGPSPRSVPRLTELPVPHWDAPLSLELPTELTCVICFNLKGDDGRRNPVCSIGGHFYCRHCAMKQIRDNGQDPMVQGRQITMAALEVAAGSGRHELDRRMQELVQAFAAKEGLRVRLDA